jgi:spore photoproduct lyase
VLQHFLNHADLNAELEQPPPDEHRLGTGEFTDSLIWEPWTGLEGLIRKFAGQIAACWS